MFIKIGEAFEITQSDVHSATNIVPGLNSDILDQMKKFAANLKKIAPRAEDFLYFSAVMMHAAEAALLENDGSPKLMRNGTPVEAHWDTTNNTWKWCCSDTNIMPYKNANGDIFPASELIKAHKMWVGKPLALDHKSSSVDHTRGIIVDTYYDHKLHRVIALCALDKINYPDLARKVSTGMQTAVSMGCGVGRAICANCNNVAKTEADFCHHMRTKSGYGEINIDLNPIELSIVVNGADPKAKIKHIIASVNHLNKYIEMKETHLSSLSITADQVSEIKTDLDNAKQKLAVLEDLLKKDDRDSNFSAFNQTESATTLTETEMPGTAFSIAPPSEQGFLSAEDNLIRELNLIKNSIDNKLSSFQQSLDKLSLSTNKEEKMSDQLNKKSYFQGGGDVNEPTPGQAKYPKDPMNEDLRENDDKQMVGQSPFPNVGDVNGLHPSPASADQKDELERKRMLARAEAEERSIRRNAAMQKAKDVLELKKKSYFHGGGELNDPKVLPYPKDPMNEDLREHDDKQMVGQKPFPDVGDVNGLHPSPESADEKDELKRKEKLLRAGLNARFTKNSNVDGSLNLGKSAWNVYLGDKLLLTASVDDISGNRSEALYDTVATKEFGEKLISQVKTLGAAKVEKLYKKAQTPPPPPAGDAMQMPAMDMPAGDVSSAPMGPMDAAPIGDEGKQADPGASAVENLEKAEEYLSDAKEAVKLLSGEQSEMGDLDGLQSAAGSTDFTALNKKRKQINGLLIHALKESIAEMEDHKVSLETVTEMLSKKTAKTAANKEFVDGVVSEVIADAKTALAEGYKLMGGFCRYASTTEVLLKKAAVQKQMNKIASEGMSSDLTQVAKEDTSMVNDIANHVDTSSDASASVSHPDVSYLESMLADDIANMEMKDESCAVDANDAMVTVEKHDDPAAAAQVAGNLADQGKEVRVASIEDRTALRAKLAAEIKWSPIFYEFHPKGGATTHLDTKPSDSLAVVENLVEKHEKMLDVANATPSVKKQAEAIQELISQGKLKSSDVDALVAEGLDKDAVSYWKKYFGEIGQEGSEFASELVKEHAKAKFDDEANKFKVKIARAYELAYEMVDRGLLHNNRSAIVEQVDAAMKWNDEAFDSMKRVIASQKPVMKKQASNNMPVVAGNVGFSDEANASNDELYSALSLALSKSTRRMF